MAEIRPIIRMQRKAEQSQDKLIQGEARKNVYILEWWQMRDVNFCLLYIAAAHSTEFYNHKIAHCTCASEDAHQPSCLSSPHTRIVLFTKFYPINRISIYISNRTHPLPAALHYSTLRMLWDFSSSRSSFSHSGFESIHSSFECLRQFQPLIFYLVEGSQPQQRGYLLCTFPEHSSSLCPHIWQGAKGLAPEK